MKQPHALTTTNDQHYVFNLQVGQTIRAARHTHGWTQAALAKRSGLSPNYIARLERGELGPSLFVANRITAALAIDLGSLIETRASAALRPRPIAAPRRRERLDEVRARLERKAARRAGGRAP